MSFPTKVIPLHGGLSGEYAPLNHNHDSVYSKLGHSHSYASTSHNHDERYALKNHTHANTVVLPDWANMIILKSYRTIHYNSSGTSWNTESKIIQWGDNGTSSGWYYRYTRNGTLVCRVATETETTVWIKLSGTTGGTARKVILDTACYVHFADGDNAIGLYRNSSCIRQIFAGRTSDQGDMATAFIFCKAGDIIYVATDANLLAVTPLM